MAFSDAAVQKMATTAKAAISATFHEIENGQAFLALENGGALDACKGV